MKKINDEELQQIKMWMSASYKEGLLVGCLLVGCLLGIAIPTIIYILISL